MIDERDSSQTPGVRAEGVRTLKTWATPTLTIVAIAAETAAGAGPGADGFVPDERDS